jgi:CheY-like chemotaxis protein
MDSYPQEGLETHPTATVLVVDDEPAIREVIATLLEDEGYMVRHAKDGLEALDTINDDEIDLIVSDVVMPRLARAQAAPARPCHAGRSDERGLCGRRSARRALRAKAL